MNTAVALSLKTVDKWRRSLYDMQKVTLPDAQSHRLTRARWKVNPVSIRTGVSMMSSETNQAGAETTSVEKSVSQTQPMGMKSVEELEVSKLEIERERLELQKAVETSRLELERLKLEREHKFWNKHSGVLITGLISLAAVAVSGAQIWSTSITQNKQMEIAQFQKKQEIEMIDRQKEKELSLTDEKNRKEWNLNAAKFVADNRKVLFEGSSQEKELLAKMIANIYPPEVSASLLAKLEDASRPAEENTWRKEREKIVRPTAPEQSPGSNPTLKPLPRRTTEEARDGSLDNRYLSEKKVGGCISKIQTNKLGDGIMYMCYQVGEDASYCNYDCYQQTAGRDR
jgi:hypothetical protein